MKRETSSEYKSGLEAAHMNPSERPEIRLLTLAVLLQSICSVHTLLCGVSSPCTAAKHRQNYSFIPLSQKGRRKNRKSKRRNKDKDRLTSEGKKKTSDVEAVTHHLPANPPEQQPS